MQNITEIVELQGSDIVDTPELPGIYAWYYRPRVFGNQEAEILGKLITYPSSIKTEIALRYGLMWKVDSEADILYGTNRRPADKVVSKAASNGGNLITSFIQNLMIPHFAKPIYIGIAENLSQRVKQHYNSLTQLWDSNTSVSRYLEANPDATVEEVLGQLDIGYSFAVDARVKGLAPRDLVVFVYPIEKLDNRSELRDLEQILQLLSDPICGRR